MELQVFQSLINKYCQYSIEKSCGVCTLGAVQALKAYSIYHELNRYGHHLRQRASQLSIFAPEHWNNVRLSTHTLLRRAQLQWFNVRAPHVPRQHAGRPVWDTFRSNLGVCHECYAMPARSAMIPLLAVSRRYVWSVRVACILTSPGYEMKMKATTFVT